LEKSPPHPKEKEKEKEKEKRFGFLVCTRLVLWLWVNLTRSHKYYRSVLLKTHFFIGRAHG
jgi:hypothetical protein